MGKKIILTEDSANMLGFRLNPKLYRQLKNGYTSLGRCNSLPDDPLEFQYHILKKRLADVTLDITPDEAFEDIQELTVKAMDIERTIRPQLQKICENTITLLFPIPDETINFTCKLSDKVNESVRLLPEDDESYEFEDVDEHVLMSREVGKRRMIDCLIMGSAHELTKFAEDYWLREVSELSESLPSLYEKICKLEDYLLFVHEQKISDEEPNQNSHVWVKLGRKGLKTEISSEAILLPYLIRESVRGFMELFSSHGLPEDNKKANHIIKLADFYVAEPWDMRLGTPLWNRFWNCDKFGTRVLPYYFKDVCCMNVDEFERFMKGAMLETKAYKRLRSQMIDDIKHDRDYERFIDRVAQKNVNQSVLSDDEMTEDDLDNVLI